jgi:cytoskeleton protein RodZ
MNAPDFYDKQMELTGPGRRLMEARNALNLSREDVARQLRLKVQTITAIEEDRIDELPAPIYVIGYLRNYARLLKVPHEPIIHTYEQLQIEAPPILSDIVKPQGKTITTRLFYWSSVVIVIVLLAGFLSWLKNQDFDLFSSAPVVVTNDIASTEEAAITEPAITEHVVTPAPIMQELPAEIDQQPVEAVKNTPVDADAVTPVGEKIVMNFKDDCWTEIIDADGKTIIYDLLRAGRAHIFYAKAPFRVFLGNASAVSMSVNEKNYDVTPHIHGTLARFTVSAAVANE